MPVRSLVSQLPIEAGSGRACTVASSAPPTSADSIVPVATTRISRTALVGRSVSRKGCESAGRSASSGTSTLTRFANA